MAVARKIYYENVRVGDELTPLLKPAIDRVSIARYAGAADDFNPNHVDEDYAKRCGFPSVFAPGSMAMGFLGQLVSEWLRTGQVKRLSSRFVKIIWPGDQLTCRGRVVDKRREGGEYYIDLEIWVENQKGELAVKGNATVKLFHSPEDEDRQRRGLSALIVEDDHRPSLVEVFERELPRIEVPPPSRKPAARARVPAPAPAPAPAPVKIPPPANDTFDEDEADDEELEALPAPKKPALRTAAKTVKAPAVKAKKK